MTFKVYSKNRNHSFRALRNTVEKYKLVAKIEETKTRINPNNGIKG